MQCSTCRSVLFMQSNLALVRMSYMVGKILMITKFSISRHTYQSVAIQILQNQLLRELKRNEIIDVVKSFINNPNVCSFILKQNVTVDLERHSHCVTGMLTICIIKLKFIDGTIYSPDCMKISNYNKNLELPLGLIARMIDLQILLSISMNYLRYVYAF